MRVKPKGINEGKMLCLMNSQNSLFFFKEMYVHQSRELFWTLGSKHQVP